MDAAMFATAAAAPAVAASQGRTLPTPSEATDAKDGAEATAREILQTHREQTSVDREKLVRCIVTGAVFAPVGQGDECAGLMLRARRSKYDRGVRRDV
jgi:threonine dehydratase